MATYNEIASTSFFTHLKSLNTEQLLDFWTQYEELNFSSDDFSNLENADNLASFLPENCEQMILEELQLRSNSLPIF